MMGGVSYINNAKLGRIGEKIFSIWCSEASITVNKSLEDEKGWDFILEFDEDNKEEQYALDKFSHGVKCFVQVKATQDSSKNSWAIKLSNWKVLISNKYPIFFFIAIIDDSKNINQAFLVHVWKDRIKKVLKRLRKSKLNNGNLLHKKTLSFNLSLDEEILQLDGDGLKKKIISYTGKDINDYILEKQRLVQQIGYDDFNSQFNLNFKVPDGYHDKDPRDIFVDFSIGELEEIEITSGEIYDNRFGILSEKPKTRIKSGSILKIANKKYVRSELRIFSKTLNKSISLPVKLFGPNGFDELDPDFFKAKIEFSAGYFIIGNKEKFDFKLKIPGIEDKIEFEKLYNAAKFFCFFSELPDGDKAELFLKGGTIGIIEIENINIPEEIIKWSRVIINTKRIIDYFNLFKQIELSSQELLFRKNEIEYLINAIDKKSVEKDTNIKFQIDNDDISIGDKFCVPHPIDIVIGEQRLIVAIMNYGRIVDEKKINNSYEYKIEIDKLEVLKHRLINRNDKLSSGFKEKFLDLDMNEIEDEYNLLMTKMIE